MSQYQYHKCIVYYMSVFVIIFNIKSSLQQISDDASEILRLVSVNSNYGSNNFHHKITCDIPNESEKGFCVTIDKCEAYKKLKNNLLQITPERVNFLKQIQCFDLNNENFGENEKISFENNVCCPSNGMDYQKPELLFSSKDNIMIYNRPRRLSQKKQKRRIQKVQNNSYLSSNSLGILNNECGKQITNRIFGGEIAELDEFPWMALLVYNSNEFGCSGSLINRRYILTAAHCVHGHVVREKKGLKYVRLGEFNVQTQPDCIEERNYLNCADVSLDVPIEKIIVHPDYDEISTDKHNDIALIKLRNTISFTHFIMPICLPEVNATNILQPGQYLSVSGWGRTDLFNKYAGNIRSPIKLKLKVPIVSKSNCTSILKTYKMHLGNKQICAGGELSKDTCAGDSGGPLMYFDRKFSRWVIYGIVSYGFTECGMADHPAVYTDVSQYVDWILKIIKN